MKTIEVRGVQTKAKSGTGGKENGHEREDIRRKKVDYSEELRLSFTAQNTGNSRLTPLKINYF